MNNTVKLKLSPPWITYVNELKALFEPDPDIEIQYDADEIEVKMYVDNPEKAEALDRLLPIGKSFGNIFLTLTIIPANNNDEHELLEKYISKKELFDIAFDRNPVYAFSKEVAGVFSNVLTYVVFKNRVVQFFNDNLNDIHGLVSTLYQDIAEEIFNDPDDEVEQLYNVFFNTDVEEKVGMPLGKWP